MKSSQQMNAIVVGLVLTAFPGAFGQTYGPNGCVSISRTQQGTCMIATNCEDGVILDKLEFAFDCQTNAQVQKHSFGVGGFDLVEEFDTGIKCAQCKVPQNHKVHKVTKKSQVHMLARRDANKEDALVDKYGPGNCVEAYRSTTGTCMIKTACKDQDISNYDVGLLCVHNVTSGENVKHLFGKASFDKEEEFDTLIKCEKCLGLRAEASQTGAAAMDANVKAEDLVKKVNTLVDEVGAMQTGLEKIKDDVKVLNEKVPKLYGAAKEGESKEKKEGEGKEGEEKKEEEKKDEDKKEGETEEKKPELFLSHHRSSRHSHNRRHQKHHQKKHHRRDEDEDEDNDEDKADDEGSDDSSSSKKQESQEQDDEQAEESQEQDDEQDDDDQDQEDSDDKKVDDGAKDSDDAN